METATAKTNNLASAYIAELKQEAIATRKCLERVPEDKFDYKPHEKSMTFGQLATHVAEMIGWATVTATTEQLDFATDYKPFAPKTNAELMEFFEKHLTEAIKALENTSDEAMMQNWTLRNGETVLFVMPRIQVLRGMVFNHIWHHRGQLSVYLRLNDIPVPSLYGPSADEGQM
jgi:uncharacterized damage-inducible protein DinB